MQKKTRTNLLMTKLYARRPCGTISACVDAFANIRMNMYTCISSFYFWPTGDIFSRIVVRRYVTVLRRHCESTSYQHNSNLSKFWRNLEWSKCKLFLVSATKSIGCDFVADLVMSTASAKRFFVLSQNQTVRLWKPWKRKQNIFCFCFLCPVSNGL